MTDRDSIKKNLIVALFAALMAAGAFIRIPVGPVPVTLTTFFLLLSALLTGPGGSVMSVIIYLIIGTAGLPAFAGGSGPAVFAGPTGGFLAGYIPAALVCGLLSGKSPKTEGPAANYFPLGDAAAVAAASLVLYAAGVPWLKWRLSLEWGQAFSAGILPFLPGDALKAAAAVSVRQILLRRAPELIPSRTGSKTIRK